MESTPKQTLNDRNHDVSYDEPEPGNGGSGGKTAGSASAGETSFDPPESGNGGSGGKTAGSASGSEH